MTTTHSVKCIAILTLSLTVCHAVVAVEDAIFHGKPEVLVSPGLVRRDGLSLDKCAKACLEEKTIKCKFFKFVNSSKTCYLSETDHPVRKYLNKITQSPGSKTLEVDTTDVAGNNHESDQEALVKLEKKLKELNGTAKKLEKVDKKVKVLKNSSKKKKADLKKLAKQNKREETAILNLRDRIALLSKKSGHLNVEINKLENMQRAVSSTIKSMENSDATLGQNVEKLTNLVTDLKEDAENINKFNETFQQELQAVSRDSKIIFEKLERLAKQLKEGKFNAGTGKQIHDDQVEIAKFLAKVAAKDKHLANKINNLQNKLEKVTRALGKTKYNSKSVMSAVDRLKQSMTELKKIVEAVADPMSKRNRKWQSDIDGINNVLSHLADSNDHLSGEMKISKQNLASVIKELTNVQLSGQDLKGQLSRLRNADAHLRKDVGELIKAKAKMPTIIQMTKMSTSILKALSAIENKEKELSRRVKGFYDSLKRLQKILADNKSLFRAYGKSMRQRDRQIKWLANELKRTQKALLFVVKRMIPKSVIADMKKVQGKYSAGMSQMQKQMQVVNRQIKALKRASKPGYIRHINSFLKSYTAKVVKALRMLQKKILSTDSDNKRLRGTVSELGKRLHTLSKKLKEIQSNKGEVKEKEIEKHIDEFKEDREKKKHKDKIWEIKEDRGKKKHKDKLEIKERKGKEKQPNRWGAGNWPDRKKLPLNQRQYRFFKRRKNGKGKGRRPRSIKVNKSKKRGRRSTPVELKTADNSNNRPSVVNNGGKNFNEHNKSRTEANTSQCPKDFHFVERYCFLFVSRPQPHNRAKQECQKYGAKLVDINSKQKELYLTSFAKRYKSDGIHGLWIAAMKYNSKKQLISENTGNEVLYKNFHTLKDQTNRPDERICSELNLDLRGTGWIGYPCNSIPHSMTPLPFVCEMDTKL